MPTPIRSQVLALHKITWMHVTGTGLEPPNCLWHLQAHLSLAGAGNMTWPTSAPELLLPSQQGVQVPRNLPPTAWFTARQWGQTEELVWKEISLQVERCRDHFFVFYINLRSKTMNWWQKLLPRGIILFWCTMDSSSLYDNRSQWAEIWYLFHGWTIFHWGAVLGSFFFTVCMVSILQGTPGTVVQCVPESNPWETTQNNQPSNTATKLGLIFFQTKIRDHFKWQNWTFFFFFRKHQILKEHLKWGIFFASLYIHKYSIIINVVYDSSYADSKEKDYDFR